MVRYTAWLALLGTVAASSLQPYFYAVNKFFRDHQRQPIAVGDLLADARCGLEILQHHLIPATTRLPLPAPVALNILQAADTLRLTLQWTPAALSQLQRFRACLAVCVNYTFFCRAETGARCQTGDLIVDRPSQQICLFVRKSKGDQCRDASEKHVLAIPVAANPVLADLLDYYTEQRAIFCTKFYSKSPPLAFWSFSPSEPSADWGAASTISTWLSLALLTVHASAPAGFKWTSHSLRKARRPLPAASARPSPQSNLWVAGPRTAL
jgi:hypothetical protein